MLGTRLNSENSLRNLTIPYPKCIGVKTFTIVSTQFSIAVTFVSPSFGTEASYREFKLTCHSPTRFPNLAEIDPLSWINLQFSRGCGEKV